jgi:hypothetical protein
MSQHRNKDKVTDALQAGQQLDELTTLERQVDALLDQLDQVLDPPGLDHGRPQSGSLH